MRSKQYFQRTWLYYLYLLILPSTFACATDCSVSDKDRTLAKLYQPPYELMTQGFLADVREKCKSEGTYVLTTARCDLWTTCSCFYYYCDRYNYCFYYGIVVIIINIFSSITIIISINLTLLYVTLLNFTELNITLHFITLLYFTLLYFTLLYFTLFYFNSLYFTLLYITLHYFTLLYFSLLHFTLLYFTLLYFTSHHITLLHITLLYFTRLRFFYIFLFFSFLRQMAFS